MKSLNIAVFGVGAMGALFGSRLSSQGNVTLFGHWTAQIETIQRDGLTVINPDGTESHSDVNITADLSAVPPADIALVLVKSYQTERTAREVAQVLRLGGLAITLQNGLGNLETLAEAMGIERAALGITAQGATIARPGLLRHAGQGPTYLALREGQEARLRQFSDLLNAAGITTELVENADSLVWGKLAINAGINPLTALLEVPNGALVENGMLQDMMTAAANEVAALAAAQGISLPFSDVAARTAEVCRATASNFSSMLQDVTRASPTEIDAISGAVVNAGRRLGIPTPVNELLFRQVKSVEQMNLSMALAR